jgi:hypothetical protein
MQVYIITAPDDFHNYFSLLKEDAKTGSTPDTFLVGLDVEYICKDNYPESFANCSSWVYETPNNIACCLIQITSRNICFLIHLPSMGKSLPNKLLNLLKNECWIKVGVGIELDLFHLSNNYKLGHCAGGIEVKNITSLANLTSNNMERLYGRLLGYPVKKSNSVCDWSKPLTKEQTNYAVKDAIMSLQIFEKIMGPTIEYLRGLDDEKEIFDFKIVNNPSLSDVQSNKQPIALKQKQINYVGMLNEYAQSKNIPLPVYKVNPKHVQGEPFETTCCFNGEKKIGYGRSKGDSKQDATMKMYNHINI